MRRKRNVSHPAASQPRPSRRLHREDDGKLPEIAVCPDCGASYRDGRWTWETAPADAYAHVCPACERIQANDPAGILDARGGFVAAHRADLVRLLRNVEQRERGEHPLKRIIEVDEGGDHVRVTATDAKLARSLGRALKHSYQGLLEEPPTGLDRGDLVSVRWLRD